jgi:hypothetical protein
MLKICAQEKLNPCTSEIALEFQGRILFHWTNIIITINHIRCIFFTLLFPEEGGPVNLEIGRKVRNQDFNIRILGKMPSSELEQDKVFPIKEKHNS